MRRRLTLSALFALAALTGCYTTTVRSGLPPGDVAPGLDAAYHQGFLFGLVEASGPHDLGRACPAGWSEIETSTDPLDVTISLVTLFIITPQKVTVVCARPESPAPPATYPPRKSPHYPPPPASP
jgi:hypothetical protein